MNATEADASAALAAKTGGTDSHVSFTDISSDRQTNQQHAAAPIVAADTSALQAQLPSNYPTRAEFERQSVGARQDQRIRSRRKRPKSANPRGRSRRVKESFIERNKRLVSEMSRKIVRPDPPPPPPSEPDEEESRQRRRHKKSKNEGKPEVGLCCTVVPFEPNDHKILTRPAAIYMNLKHTFTLAPTQHMTVDVVEGDFSDLVECNWTGHVIVV